MAGDWIKMRADISRDPRVIAIADALSVSRPFMDWLTSQFGASAACRESAYERVTRCVTVSVTVTALVRVWSLARTQGRVRGDDVILDFATLSALDVISEVPDFGLAMASVKWVVERTDSTGLIFPKFLRQNTTPEERRKEKAAERKQRQRERDRGCDKERDIGRDKSVTRHTNVTHRVEESREEENKEEKPFSEPPKTAGSGGDRKARKERKPRQPDHLFDAVAEVTGSDPKASGSFVGAVVASLRKADPPYTPEDVREFARRFNELCPWSREKNMARPTLGTIEKNIGLIRAAPPERNGTVIKHNPLCDL